MKVTLIAYTPNPELIIATAARSSASPLKVTELYHKLTPEQIDNLFRRLLASGHLSPFEHASFTFVLEGISRVTSHQLVRHRIASYTQQSQRYVSLKEPKFIIPPTISSHSEFLSKYKKILQEAHQLYWQMIEAGIPAEDARYVLPQAIETQLVMTMNARELIHAASLRLCLKAQWEIVDLFEGIKVEVTKVAPRLGAELKAKCYRLGYCDEKESCGLFPITKLTEVKTK